MRVYRNNKQSFGSSVLFPMYKGEDGKFHALNGAITPLQPKTGLIVETGPDFDDITSGGRTIECDEYYRMDGVESATGNIIWTKISQSTAQGNSTIAVFDIMEATYTGQDMGERSITATIQFHSPIDFQIGDYIEIELQDLRRFDDDNNYRVAQNDGGIQNERFYIYTEPTCKKTARPMSVGDAFETTVKFMPPQYELACIQMRDILQEKANADMIIYTGFDNVSFYGGAKELLDRCMACLAQQFVDNDGKPLWSYVLADAVNEEKNRALERYAFSFKGNSVMDAIMKLNDAETINSTFFINGRTIYVGFKRPYLCQVNAQGAITHDIYKLMYGKTSHLPINIDHGGLFDITKTVTDEAPITKLYAYGANRNLNRYYCSDRIKSGRYVNHLMLPSFSDDGRTDYIISDDGVEKYGIREGSKEFEEVYPSLRYMTYADIRGVKYCIKIKTNGIAVENVAGEYKKHVNEGSYPIARLQCYKVVPCTGQNGDGTLGVNKLVECAPPDDMAVFVHATGKVVKCILYGSSLSDPEQAKAEAIQKQLAADAKIPTTDGLTPAQDYSNVHPGACFAIHDNGWVDMDGTTHTDEERASWFTYDSEDPDQTATLHRIEYTDTFWITDLYVFQDYDQAFFQRDGYSAWAWPRLNNDSGFDDSLLVNEIMAVSPITIVDTCYNEFSRQHTFDIYMRDLGFKIDEQDDFGEMVFIFDTITASILDGLLAGREFHIAGKINDHQDTCVCAYNDDGTINPLFEKHDPTLAATAKAKGAIWRLTLTRENDKELQDIGLILPTKDICAKEGDHYVLLDIYMPDIYIRAAENRLLKEAQRYLERNDRGNAQYAISMDKVRMLQVPNLALQMREGVMLRMIDEDLNILSPNKIRNLFPNSTQYQVPMYTIEHDVQWENQYYNENFHGDEEGPEGAYIISKNVQQLTFALGVPGDEDISEIVNDSVKLFYSPHPYPSFGDWTKLDVELNSVTTVTAGYILSFKAKDIFTFQKICVNTGPCKCVQYTEKVASQSTHKYSNKGLRIYAMCDTLIDFLGGKYYEVEVEVESRFVTSNPRPAIMLSMSKNVDAGYFVPTYEVKLVAAGDGGNTVRLKYSFYLDDSFNDATPYYISIPYTADGETEYGKIILHSVVEKDMNEQGDIVKYADFTAESVTIKITDNTRPADTRINGAYPMPERELSATLKEKSQASTWASLQQVVDNTRIEVSMNQKTVENLMNEARMTYQTLLSLRNSIFDPDTDTNNKCDYNFLHVMMLQVGADSMNYQLEKTFTTPTGVMSNFNVTQKTSQANGVFSVNQEDRLHHFVYTQGIGNGGNWVIPGMFSANLDPNADNTWPVYYVCIRCKKDTQNDLTQTAWICSTDQYAVNQDKVPSTGATTNEYGDRVDSYWYFNWGILTCPNQDGNYILTETRGNAYMYGDNIIAGKISTIAGNSYFDLTHGNFVLGEGTEGSAALSYIDGVLTVRGIKDGNGNDILERIGLLEADIIGGDNLYNGQDPYRLYASAQYYDLDIDLEDGVKYVLTIGEVNGNGFGLDCMEKISSSYTRLGILIDNGINGTMQHYDNLQLKFTGNGGKLSFRIRTSSAEYYYEMSRIMLQKGTKATTYHEYVQHLTDAIRGSTEISGGLTMTNLLMLKDEAGNVMAGMSGLTDNGDMEIEVEGSDQEVHSEGVTLWGGGSYQEALEQAAGLINSLPLLLTKTGIGSRIGCFEVISENEVAVYNAAKDSRIKISAGEDMSIRMQKYENGEWVDKLLISDESVDVRYQFFVMKGCNGNPRKYKDAGTAMTSSMQIIHSVNLPSVATGTYYKCNISESNRLLIHFQTNWSGWQQRQAVLYGSVGLYMISRSGSSISYIAKKVSDWREVVAYNKESGNLSFVWPLFDYSSDTLGSGEYAIVLEINKLKRTNGAGVSYEYEYDDSVMTACRMDICINHDISFAAVDPNEKRLVHLGNNGLKVTVSSAAFFMVKNNGTDIDIRMSGLPNENQASQLDPRRVYVENNILKIT